MNIIVVDNYENMSRKAAIIIASQIISKPNSILGLATGSTPLGMYKELIKMYENKELDFSKVKTFNLDEYYGLDEKHVQSYHFYMNDNFFKYINIKRENIKIPNGMCKNIDEECESYDKSIVEAGGIDIQVLGIGSNGHIGFNEPDDSFNARTHLVTLNEKTIRDNSRFFKSIDKVPTKAISMGIKSIMMSRKIILLANGEEKAEAISKSIEGNITSKVPGSILQLHNDVTFILDKKAAKRLNKCSFI